MVPHLQASDKERFSTNMFLKVRVRRGISVSKQNMGSPPCRIKIFPVLFRRLPNRERMSLIGMRSRSLTVHQYVGDRIGFLVVDDQLLCCIEETETRQTINQDDRSSETNAFLLRQTTVEIRMRTGIQHTEMCEFIMSLSRDLSIQFHRLLPHYVSSIGVN